MLQRYSYLLLLLFPLSLLAQFDMKWVKQSGHQFHERYFSTSEYPTSGSVAAGEYYERGNKKAFPLVTRFDMDGNILWSNNFPHETNTSIRSVCADNSGNIYAAGVRQDNKYDPYTDFFVMKISSKGDMIWEKQLRGAGYDNIEKILYNKKTNKLVIAGFQDVKYYNEHHGVIMQLDTAGNKDWRYVYAGSYGDQILDIAHTADGGYVFTGFEKSDTNGYKMILVGKISADGEQLWTQVLESGSTAIGNSIIELTDGTFALCGVVREETIPVHDILIMRLNSTGDEIWKKIIRKEFDEEASSIVATERKTLLTLAYSKSRQKDKTNLWLLETDLQGEQLWEKTLYNKNVDFGYEITQTQQKDVLIAGATFNHTTQNWDGTHFLFSPTDAPIVELKNPTRQKTVAYEPAIEFEAELCSLDSAVFVQFFMNSKPLETTTDDENIQTKGNKFLISAKAKALLNKGNNYLWVKASNVHGETQTALHSIFYFMPPQEKGKKKKDRRRMSK